MHQQACTRALFQSAAFQVSGHLRELDELLHGFLDRRYAGLDPAQQAVFAVLLEYPDAVLLELLMGRMLPADKDVADVVQEIRNAAQS